MDDAILLDAATVRYRLSRERLSIRDLLVGSRRVIREHVALDSVDLAVKRGEAIGVIGLNGAGKSTLLRVLARIVRPNSGRLRIKGRVAPLLDLTGAFHPELTGRENVSLQASIHGVRHEEIARRFDEIAAFADIGTFIDAPLRTYSAGMMLRLGFAVMINIDADILLIDEALGVGDAGFQEKCSQRIAELRDRGLSFVIVSHDLARLRELCDRILWLDHGRARLIGDPTDVVAQYAATVTR